MPACVSLRNASVAGETSIARLLRRHTLVCLLLAPAAVLAQDIRLVGTVGGRLAIVMVDGSAPKTLRIGQELQGVRLLSVTGNEATLEVNGTPKAMRVGQAPARVGRDSGGLLLNPSNGGHYLVAGSINGHTVNFMIDTGASAVAMDEQTARRLGIAYEQGVPVRIATANGETDGWTLELGQVQAGPLVQHKVAATVTRQPMPYVLLGNSFLNHYRMTRDANAMLLQPR